MSNARKIADLAVGGNMFIFENEAIVTKNYTITNGKNGVSAGPVQVNPGATVTVPAGSAWKIV